VRHEQGRTHKGRRLEILKKIQRSLADVRNAQFDMRRDIRELKSSNARILGMIGEMVKAHASVDDRFKRP
jgi:hypothetical protein